MTETATAIHSAAGTGIENDAFGLRRTFRVTSHDTGGAFAIFEEEILEGSGPPLHVHHKEIETFVILDGAVRFQAGADAFTAGPGDIITIPAGLPHTFKGKGPGTARVLIQLTPGEASNFFPALSAAGLDPATDMPAIVALAEQYNLEFVGPPMD